MLADTLGRSGVTNARVGAWDRRPSASVDTEKADSIAVLPRAFRVVPRPALNSCSKQS